MPKLRRHWENLLGLLSQSGNRVLPGDLGLVLLFELEDVGSAWYLKIDENRKK